MAVSLGPRAERGSAAECVGLIGSAQRRVPAVGEERLTGRSVLVVEDEGLIALELKELFEDAGARVLTAADIGEGLRLAETAQIGLAVVDYRIGSHDAAEICRRLLARAVPFFFFTGDPTITDQWPDIPALQKPASDQEILAAAAALVERVEE